MPLLLLLFCLVSLCFGAEKASVTGDWHGELKTPGPTLRLALHVRQDEKGALTATLDSLDQGSMGMPVGTVTLTERKVTLTLPAVRGSYEGELSEDGKMLTGQWTQGGQPLPLTFTRGMAVAEPDQSATVVPLLGVWEGSVEAGSLKLRLRVTLTRGENGQVRGTFESIDQGAQKLPISGLSLTGTQFHFDLRGAAASYDGTVNADRTTLQGTWQQLGRTTPLVLTKVDKPTALVRPQEPKPPYPYRVEEVAFANAQAPGVTLAGTLTMPSGKGLFPAVVLLSGSGPQDRDEALLGHRPFWVLADHLTRQGIAVLRYDDRGVGKSTGTFAGATLQDFTADAEAAVAFLRSRPEIAAHHVGLVGHSEGGTYAPLLAGRSRQIAFIVLLAAPGVSSTELLVAQAAYLMKTSGKSEEEQARLLALQREVLAIVRSETQDAVAREKLQQAFAKADIKDAAPSEGSLNVMVSPWFRSLLTYDPATTLAKVRVPVLALNGEKDSQVEAKANLTAIQHALSKAGNTDVTVREMAGLNHLLQRCTTGSMSEYSSIAETMNPAALQLVSAWIVKTTR